MKTHKTKKSKRMRGKGMGTHGWGARKKHKKSGHRGGSGMAGTGKRGDQKKTLITKKYGNNYFGKKGITSRGTKRDKSKRINVSTIIENIENYVKKGQAKKTNSGYEIELKDYKILAGKDFELKEKVILKAKDASKKAIEKIEKAGGKVELQAKKLKESEE
jgi:large subunit ribosomal protein L15